MQAEKKKTMRICLVGASHFVDDDRMYYRQALALSTTYPVEVVGVGQCRQTVERGGIRVTSYRKRSKARHIGLLLEIYLHLRSARFDVLHCFDLDALLVAVFTSRLHSMRPLIVYDAHEHFPSLIAGYFELPRFLSLALEILVDAAERFLASFCCAFVVVNDWLKNRFLVFNRPTVVVRNVASLSWYDVAPKTNVLENVRDPIIIFGGNLGQKKGLETVIRAKMILDKERVNTCFVLTGNIKAVSDYPSLADAGFKLMGWLDHDVLPSFLKVAKVGLVPLQPANLNYSIAQPNKLFAYMVASLPVVASDLPAIRAIVLQENCGILVDPGDAAEFARAISRLLKEDNLRISLGSNGRKAAEREYNWEKESQKLLALYKEIERMSPKTELQEEKHEPACNSIQ
jgi:glycosyltransferase involved in cell wall biosynthesis